MATNLAELPIEEQLRRLAEEEAKALKEAQNRPNPKAPSISNVGSRVAPVTLPTPKIPPQSQPVPGLGRPIPPNPAVTASPGAMSVGNFAGTFGKGVRAIGRIAGRASLPLAIGSVVTSALERGTDAYMENEYKKRHVKPTAAQKRAENGQATLADQTGDKTGGADEVTVLPGMETSNPRESTTVRAPDEAAPRATSSEALSALSGQKELRAEKKAKRQERRAARTTPEDQALDTAEQTINGNPDTPAQEYKAPRATINPADEKVVGELSKNRVDRETPKETFGRKLKRFVVAGSGPADFTRMDKQEEDLYQKRNQFTDRERFGAANAASRVGKAEDRNYEADVADYKSEGISPSVRKQNEIDAELAKELGLEERKAANRSGEQLAEHGYRMEQIKAGAGMEKLTSEQQALQLKREILAKFPDADPAMIQELTGMALDPAFVASVRQGRTNIDPTKEALKELIKERMSRLQGGTSGQKPAQNVNLSALK